MKLIKIRFTAWRDQGAPRRTAAFQGRLDAWTTRLSVLFRSAARIKDRQSMADCEALQKQVTAISAEMQKINAGRTLLRATEKAAAKVEARVASQHKKAGTFGYEVLDETDNRVSMVVDEYGNELSAKAVYAFEVVDTDPPLPKWAKEKEQVLPRKG